MVVRNAWNYFYILNRLQFYSEQSPGLFYIQAGSLAWIVLQHVTAAGCFY